MRMNGEMPSCVFIDDFKIEKSRWSQDDDYLSVNIQGDSIKTLDLRFLFGLDIRITTESENRASEIFKAAIKNNANSIAAYACDGKGNGKMIIYLDGKQQVF